MSAIQMRIEYKNSVIELPCAFIDRFMPKCTPVYALIYIYGLRQCLSGAHTISSQDISQIFQILETDVVNAWRYWETEGLIRLEMGEDGMSVSFLSVPPEPEPEPQAVEPPPKPVLVKPFVMASRPQYTVDELTFYQEQSKEISRLFQHTEQALGKMLTYNDLNVVFGFYDWLRLPVDVIMYLLTYCSENGRRDLRYVEKAALDWAEHGIDDVEKALTYVQTFDRDYREVLRAMGQDTGFPTTSQLKYIDKWLHEYEMPVALILVACDKAAVQIGKPKFNYVDKIMTDWHQKGIRTEEAVKLDAERFAKQQSEKSDRTEMPAKAPKAAAAVKKNRFVNFQQRDLDYVNLEKMEREYLIQSLKG